MAIKLQCKHIPDELVIRAIEYTWPRTKTGSWRNHDDVKAMLDRLMSFEIPHNLYIAKMHKLNERGLISVCDHYPRNWCRGDIYLPHEAV